MLWRWLKGGVVGVHWRDGHKGAFKDWLRIQVILAVNVDNASVGEFSEADSWLRVVFRYALGFALVCLLIESVTILVA